MKTAVEWLVHELGLNCTTDHEDEIQEALEMEKEQIVKAVDCIYLDNNGNQFTGQQYYNETFKQ
jgi:hypothetical protein